MFMAGTYTNTKPLRFIHIPKNAGTSVYHYLTDNDIRILSGSSLHKRVHHHRYAAYWKDEDSFKFAIVRDPYTRTVSYYNYTLSKEWNPTFKEFVENQLVNENMKVPNAWIPQIKWIYHNNASLVDKIFKFESLNEDLKEFFNLSNSLYHQNQSTYNNYEDYYNSELKQLVYEAFKEDFDTLGYNK